METGLRPNSAGIPYTLLLRIEATGFPTFGLLLWGLSGLGCRILCLGPKSSRAGSQDFNHSLHQLDLDPRVT